MKIHHTRQTQSLTASYTIGYVDQAREQNDGNQAYGGCLHRGIHFDERFGSIRVFFGESLQKYESK